MKLFRTLAGIMCIAILVSSMALTAYAGGGDEYVETQPSTVATEPEAISVETEPITLEPGIGFIDEGNLVTRDLLYDKATNSSFLYRPMAVIHFTLLSTTTSLWTRMLTCTKLTFSA